MNEGREVELGPATPRWELCEWSRLMKTLRNKVLPKTGAWFSTTERLSKKSFTRVFLSLR